MLLEDLDIQYDIKLGQGFLTQVYLAVHKKTQYKFATNLDEATQEEKKSFLREIEIQKLFNHPNIVKFYGHFYQNKKLYIIMEYMPKGNLFKIIRHIKLTTEQIKIYFQQILKAVSYIHNKGTFHRDIKPENILVAEDNTMKLSDFGFSTSFKDGPRSTVCGTRDYIAPEVAAKQPQNEKVDIWTLGILLYEMVYNKPPFQMGDVYTMYHKKTRPEIKYYEQTIYRPLIEICLQLDPKKRPSADALLLNPVFMNLQISKVYIEESKKRSHSNNTSRKNSAKKVMQRKTSFIAQTKKLIDNKEQFRQNFSDNPKNINLVNLGNLKILNQVKTIKEKESKMVKGVKIFNEEDDQAQIEIQLQKIKEKQEQLEQSQTGYQRSRIVLPDKVRQKSPLNKKVTLSKSKSPKSKMERRKEERVKKLKNYKQFLNKLSIKK